MDDVDAEIAAHLAMRCEQLVAQGMTLEAARLEAQRQFGDIDGTRAAILALDQVQVSHTRRREWWQGLLQDARHAFRLLRLSPAFTAVAVTTLALGIGASAAIFSVVHQVLLRPLPFPDQQRLVRAGPVHPERSTTAGPLSVPDFDDWRQTQHEFAQLGAYWYTPKQGGVDLTGLGQPERLRAAQITSGFFETLAVRPEIGRLPSADEMAEGGPRVAVISDGLWRRRFGSDATIIGRALLLDGVPHVVVGVMPASMRFPGDGPEVWLSALYEAQSATPWKNRAVRWLTVIGRLAPGVTVDRARHDLAALQRHLAQAYPDADEGWTDARVTPLLDTLVGDVRPALLILFGAAGCVLLIASANIAALLLARASVREREFAVRAALGAPKGRLVQQVLTESFLLALLGGIVGMVVAAVLLPLLVRLSAGELPRVPGGAVDWTVAAYTLAVATLSGLVVGAPPAIQLLSATARPALADSGGGARGSTAGARRMRSRQMLVVAEIAIAVVLVSGASLMAKSFRRLLATDAGFRPDHTLVIGFTIATGLHSDAQSVRFYQTVLDRVRDVPGVIAAGATKILPLEGDDDLWPFGIVGQPLPPLSQRPTVTVNHISADYFRTIGTPIVAGREFVRTDTVGAPDVAIVNEAFAHRYFPGPLADVPHQALVFGVTRVPIVGVVRSVHESSLGAAPAPAAYVATTQNLRGAVSLVVRTRSDPTAMTGAIKQAIWSIDKDQTITSVTTLDDVVRRAVARPRLLSVLLASFAALGLLLGALGIYGVVAYSVSARRQEIGVRMALGADQRAVLALVVGRGLALALGGVAIGLVVSLIVTRVMRAVLFEIAPTDPVTYGEVIATLTAVALLAAYLPARRATRIDATEALRGT